MIATDRVGIGVRIRDCDNRNAEARGLLDGVQLAADVDNEHGTGTVHHVLDAREVLLELRELAAEH